MATDVACVNDLDLSGATVTGDSELAQRVYGRLTTARGTLIDDDSYGILTAAYLGKPNVADKYAIDAEIEVHREPGAESARVFVTSSQNGIATIQVGLGQKTIAIPILLGSSSYAVPTIVSISPTSGIATGGQLVVITGTGFDGVTAVTLSPGTGFFSYFGRVDSSTIHAITAVSSPATYGINVTTPGGTATLPASYTFTSALSVTGVSPNIGANATNQTLTITGTGFAAGATVTVGGASTSSVVVVNATTITCALGLGTPAGLLTVAVTSSGTASLASAFVALEVAFNGYQLYHAGAGVVLGSGSTISTVADQGASAQNLTAAGATSPTLTASDGGYNNRPTFNFSVATSRLASPAFAVTQPVTRFVVGNTSGSTSPQYLVDGLSGYLGLSANAASGGEAYANASFAYTGNASIKQVHCVVYNGASSIQSLSSTTENSGNVGTSTPGGLTIGTYYAGSFGCMGTVALVLQINGTLTKTQRDLNKNLLGTYYGKTIT